MLMPALAQQRADAADEAGRVLVDDVEHVPVELGLDADAEDFDQPRRVRCRTACRRPSGRPGWSPTVTRTSVW